MIDGIKKCPFCRSAGTFINSNTIHSMHTSESDLFWVECDNCGASGSAEKTREDAISSWNYVSDAVVNLPELLFVRNKGVMIHA